MLGHTYKINSIVELDDERVGNTYMISDNDKPNNDELPEIVSVSVLTIITSI